MRRYFAKRSFVHSRQQKQCEQIASREWLQMVTRVTFIIADIGGVVVKRMQVRRVTVRPNDG